MEEADEGERRAVQDRDLGPLDLDQAIVQADAGGGGEHVLDRADRDAVVLERGGVVERRGGVEPGGNRTVRMVQPHEDEAVIDGRRTEMRLGWMARVQADALDGDCGSQCRLLSHAFYTQSIRSQ